MFVLMSILAYTLIKNAMKLIQTKYADDPIVKPFGVVVQDQKVLIKSLLGEIINQGNKIPLSKANKVSLMSLFRLRESLNSILLLTLNGFVRDANVLFLTLIELHLDIKYIGCDEKRADHWIKHSRQETKPWKVAWLISELYPDSSEFEANKYIYRYYSAIKHANPAVGNESFPLGVMGEWLVFENEQNISNLIAVTLFGVGLESLGIIEAAIDTFVSRGFSLTAFKKSVVKQKEQLKGLNSQHIRQMLRLILQRNK